MAVTQSHFRFGINSGTEASHGWHAAEDTNPSAGTIGLDVTFLLRFCLQCDGTALSNIDAEFQYRKNGGTWTQITTATTNVKAVTPATWADGANTTQRLSGTGTFEASSAGCTADGISGGTAFDIVASGNGETECGLQLLSAGLVNGDVIDFRLTRDGGTLIDTYAVTPSLTVADITAPTLSAQAVGTVTTTGGTPTVTTNETNGTAYMVMVADGTSPSVAQIKAGQNASGAAAFASQNIAVSGTSLSFTAITSLTSNTAYDCWFVHTDAAANDSTAVKADLTTAFSFNDARQAIINGIDSAQAEATGWDALRSTIPVTAVVRTSATVATITLPAIGLFNISATETLTHTIPASALVLNAAVVATPTLTITAVATPAARQKTITRQAIHRASGW